MIAAKTLTDELPDKICSELLEAIEEERKRSDMKKLLRALRR